MQRYFIFVLLALNLACQPKAEETLSPSETSHFDIPAYFAQEAKRLAQIENLEVEKTIIQNNTTEVDTTQIDNWEQELAFFTKNKIHEITLQDQYKADSVFQNGNLAIHYTTTNEELATQKASIYFEKDQITKVELVSQAQNAVYKTTRYLTYQPHKGYKIKKDQKVVLFEEDEFLIELRFLNE